MIHHQITEDTPPDMLAGAMDLTVHLPTGRSVKMSVERSTPMMDLLFQITTANHLQLSDHVLHALGMAPSSQYSDKVLPYKPSTPIGALDTQHIRVVPKNKSAPVPRNVPPGHQPFESTFRLKVHLPRNQLYVIRVSQNVFIDDIMNKVCEEKNLDSSKYECRHPGSLEEVLDPKLTLSDYQITEIYVVVKGTVGLQQAYPTTDIMALRKEEERKQLHNKTASSVFNLIFKKGKSSMGSGSLSSDNRSISPTQSDESRSVTPPATQPKLVVAPPQKVVPSEKPKPPQRKRRPAPKPPQIVESQKSASPEPIERPDSNVSSINSSTCDIATPRKTENGLTICHSRNSSDSSGYHEASILSDHCNTSLPRRPKTVIVPDNIGRALGEHSRSTGNLAKMSLQSKSMSSLHLPGRKKKAAPPPPPVLKGSTSVANLESASPVVNASQPQASSDISEASSADIETSRTIITQPLSKISENNNSVEVEERKTTPLIEKLLPINESNTTKLLPINEKVDHDVDIVKEEIYPCESPILKAEIKLSPKEETILTPDIDEEHKSEVDSGVCLTANSSSKFDLNLKDEENDLDTEWQYQLPSPPKAFRDSSPTNHTNYETVTLQDFNPTESVVTSPELFEKLKDIQAEREAVEASDVQSNISEDERILNKLSLENLEKRKSLVYNRELSTSLKFAQEDSVNNRLNKDEPISVKKSNVIEELEGVISTGKTVTLSRNNSKAVVAEKSTPSADATSALPNFKITTYDKPKEKINIFEDDTIRSNSDSKRHSIVDIKPSEEFAKPSNLIAIKKNSLLGSSMDNISFKRQDFGGEDMFKKPPEYGKYKSKLFSNDIKNVSRTSSFSMHMASNLWSPSVPVKRSHSQLALNKYESEQRGSSLDTEMSKSNSLYDVSGLQSLQVIRKIQTSLKTPNGSTEHLEDVKSANTKLTVTSEQQENAASVEKVEEPTIRTHQFRGPPAINLGTWSERPKTHVNLKEDSDYKFNVNKMEKDNINSKLIVNTTHNNVTSNNTIEVRSKMEETNITRREEPKGFSGVSIKVNGGEAVKPPQQSVCIKIEGGDKPVNSNRITVNNVGFVTTRKPLGNINKIDVKGQRPHSVAFDSDYQPPIVRSVEYKKPLLDMQNKSITQIYSNNVYDSINNGFYNGNEAKTSTTIQPKNKNSQVYLSSESVNKPAQKFTVPVVKGFRNLEASNNTINRMSWNGTNYAAPSTINNNTKKEENYLTNNNVPFSQLNLKRTESNKILLENGSSNSNNLFGKVVLRSTANKNNLLASSETNTNTNGVPSAPPNPPKPPPLQRNLNINNVNNEKSDPRAELLSAIRNFGGKKGLKSVKN